MRTIPKKRATFFVTVLFVSVCLLTDFLPLPAWAGKDINTIEAKAKLGDANFEAILGLIYADGKEVPQNYTKAAYWFRLSANQGNAIAQLLLGLFYEKGQGVPQNAAKAKYWYRLAANQGNAQAQFFLGFVYYKGNSFPKNYTKSAYWFHLAANQGISRAQTILGVQYEDGQGVPQSYYKADQWYRLAANQGNSTAQLFLGLNFFHGRGVPQNYEKAYKWLLLSRSRGGKMMVAASKIEFDQLKSLMTHGQIAEAQRLAGEWTAVNAKNESRLRKLQPQISDTPLITKKVILRYNSPVDHPSFNLPKHQSWYAVVVGVEQYQGNTSGQILQAGRPGGQGQSDRPGVSRVPYPPAY